MNIRAKFLIQFPSIAWLMLILLIVTACGPVNDETTTISVTILPSNAAGQDSAGHTSTDGGYPLPAAPQANTTEQGYPGQALPEGIMAEPPDPERELTVSSPEFGAVGGVLIQEIVDAGFLPVTPRAFYLGEILDDNTGRQALIARGVNSPEAQLFPTGVFAFNGIQPGTYGLVIDLGFAEFPLKNEDGSELLIQVEAGKVLDLGQLLIEAPN